jgi:hypothetical protein
MALLAVEKDMPREVAASESDSAAFLQRRSWDDPGDAVQAAKSQACLFD